jgi:KaiC/GvpD/RAD55 family RecA-like ATPase
MNEVGQKANGNVAHVEVSGERSDFDLSLPAEIRTFVARPGPQSLLIRGSPGSGKTTLGLALLGAFPGQRILVTNRVSDTELRGDFPWLHLGGVDPIQVIDASNRTRGLAEAALAVHDLPKVLSGETGGEVSNFMWLPEAVQEAYSSMESDRPSMVIIDSWDALVEDFMATRPSGHLPTPVREDVERLLLSFMRRSGVTLVLILERDVQTQLDYLVNAVVTTEKELVNGRLERWLYIPKLRGQRIETPSYPFSLEGSRFRTVRPFRFGRRTNGGQRASEIAGEPPPEPMVGRVWPGCIDFAMAFGMFNVGATTVIETDPEVPHSLTQVLVDPPVVQTLLAGGRVLLIPPPGTRPDDIYQPYHSIVPAEKLADQLRIFSVAGTEGVPEEAQAIMLPMPRGPGFRSDPIFHAAFEFIRQEGTPNVPNLIVRTTGGERALAQMVGLPVTPENFATVAAAYVANLHSHQIVIGNIGDSLLVALNDLSSIRLQLRAREGRYFLNGVRPFTPSYVITEGDQLCPYRLMRMV